MRLVASRRGLVAVALVASVAACASRSAPATLPLAPTASGLDQLRADLDRIFTAPEFEHMNWGVKIESLQSGETIYRLNDRKLLLPASNQKLLTSAVAAERLGWDYRFTTRLLATGAVDASGTLQGDLVVVGNGDPTVNMRHEQRGTLFQQWAATLQARGIRAINGRIIGDDNLYEEPGLGLGWTWENLVYGFGTGIGALQFNENQFAITVAPSAVGGTATLTAMPFVHDLRIDNSVVTAAAGVRTNIDLARIPGSDVLHVIGEIAVDARPSTMFASVANPTRFYVNAMKAAFVERGLAVSGEAVDIDDLEADPEPAAATELLVDRSPVLNEIIDVCLKWSRNDYAETLLRALAPKSPAGATAGLAVARTQLAAWGLDRWSFVSVDGSGLSRQDYVTAHGLNLLLTYLWMEPKHADVFRSTLPVAGVSGTLADRMKGTPLEGRVFAKTGTLSNVRSLSGYLFTRAGEPIVFSMLSNNFQVPAADVDAAMERALLRVLELSASQ